MSKCARFPHVGDHVIFHDSKGNPHNAVLTAVWGPEKAFNDHGQVPCVNLVYVSADNEREDTYGRQIERETSLVHAANQPAHGMYWRWPEEEINPVAECQS